MNDELNLTEEQTTILMQRWTEMQQSLIQSGTDALRNKQAEMDRLEATTVNPLHHLDMDMFTGEKFISSLMTEVRSLLLAEMERLESKDGEHDWLHALENAIKATEDYQ